MNGSSPKRDEKRDVKVQAWFAYDLLDRLDQAAAENFTNRTAMLIRYVVAGLKRDGYLK